MNHRFNRTIETGPKEPHLIHEITKGMKKEGRGVFHKGTKTQREIRKEHGTKLKALRNRHL